MHRNPSAYLPHAHEVRFARPKSNNVLSNLFETSSEGKKGENQGDNQEMNHNSCNCRRLAFYQILIESQTM